jgi:hypothetical protein
MQQCRRTQRYVTTHRCCYRCITTRCSAVRYTDSTVVHQFIEVHDTTHGVGTLWHCARSCLLILLVNLPYSVRKITESLGNVTLRGENNGKSKGEALWPIVCLSVYSITENIYYSQLSCVAILLKLEPVFTSCSTRKYWALSPNVLSPCGLPLPPTCLLITANEARSYFAYTILHGDCCTCLSRVRVLWQWLHPPLVANAGVCDCSIHGKGNCLESLSYEYSAAQLPTFYVLWSMKVHHRFHKNPAIGPYPHPFGSRSLRNALFL